MHCLSFSSLSFASASLLGAQHISASASPSVSLRISAAAPRNPFHRRCSSYRCQSLPSPILSPLPVSSPRRRLSSRCYSRPLRCCVLLLTSWRRLCKSNLNVSLPLRFCPSPCRRVSSQCGSRPLLFNPTHFRSLSFLTSSLPLRLYACQCLRHASVLFARAFRCHCLSTHRRRVALHIGPSLRPRCADLSNAAASLVFAAAFRFDSPPLHKSVLLIAFAPLISPSPSPCYAVPGRCYSARISAAAVRFRAWLFSAAALQC